MPSPILSSMELKRRLDEFGDDWAIRTDPARSLKWGARSFLQLCRRRASRGKPLPTAATSAQRKWGLKDEHLPELTAAFLSAVDLFVQEMYADIVKLAPLYSDTVFVALSPAGGDPDAAQDFHDLVA